MVTPVDLERGPALDVGLRRRMEELREINFDGYGEDMNRVVNNFI